MLKAFVLFLLILTATVSVASSTGSAPPQPPAPCNPSVILADLTVPATTANTMCPDGRARYAIDLEAGETIRIEVLFTHDQGDIDLVMLDPEFKVSDFASSVTDDEILIVTAGESGVHHLDLQVAGPIVTSGVDYRLSVSTATVSGCIDDTFEDDDSRAAATPLDVPRTRVGRICAGDPDHLAFDARAGERIGVDAAFSNAEGDIDLVLWSPAGDAIATATSVTDDERLVIVAPTTGTYILAVDAYFATEQAPVAPINSSVEYRVDVALGATDLCVDDSHEENDTNERATTLSPGESRSAISCEGDVDIYVLQMEGAGSLTFDASFEHEIGDLDLTLFGLTGELIDQALSASDDESITTSVAEPGVFFLHVAPAGSVPPTGIPYGVVATIESTGECVEDAFEDNDDRASATDISDIPRIEATACAADSDNYAIALSEGDSLAVALGFSHGTGDLDLSLVDPSGATVAASTSVTDDEGLEHRAREAGTYTLAVRPYVVAPTGTDYTLDVERSRAPACEDDVYEEAEPIVVAPGVPLDLVLCPDDVDGVSFDAEAGDVVTLDVGFAHHDGDIDLLVVNAAGDVMGSSTSSSDDERVTFTAEGGPFVATMSLYLDPGDPGVPYVLSVLIGVTAPSLCDDDLFEDNDDVASAIPSVVDVALVSCPGDDDVFVFHAAFGQPTEVAVRFSAIDGDIDLLVVGPDGQVVASRTSVDDDEVVEFVPTATGPHYIRVTLFSDPDEDGVPYELAIRS